MDSSVDSDFLVKKLLSNVEDLFLHAFGVSLSSPLFKYMS